MLFRAIATAYGSSQATGGIGVALASLCQSHSKAGSELHLGPTPQLMAIWNPQPTERGQGSNPPPHGYEADSFPVHHNGNSKTCGYSDLMGSRLEDWRTKGIGSRLCNLKATFQISRVSKCAQRPFPPFPPEGFNVRAARWPCAVPLPRSLCDLRGSPFPKLKTCCLKFHFEDQDAV